MSEFEALHFIRPLWLFLLPLSLLNLLVTGALGGLGVPAPQFTDPPAGRRLVAGMRSALVALAQCAASS